MKKSLVTTIQVAATLAILYFIFRDSGKRAEMLQVLGSANHWWLLAGFLTYGVVELVAAVRWRLLLNVQGIALSWKRLNALLLIGVFFNYFIPGGTGGDVVKIYYLLKETPGQRGPALLSVLVDRIAGVLALCILTGSLVIANWSWLMSSPETRRYTWPALLILGSSLGGLHFTYVVTKYGWIHKLPARMPGRDKLAELALAYHLYGKAWRESLAALALSLVANAGYFVVFYCAARALHTSAVRTPTLIELCTVMPIVSTIAAMPISLGGIGVREGLFQVFLGALCGVSAAVAVLISSLGYLLT
ncbi:MAG TPA: lysylphosphatidylglycerol synthase transmembrane domain-containing protein, partial [Chthoniobacteraceae bacterium]|nr:lysylphosphatidylglycerol synthase transmembrane domain-containing protein [Chthoniobacteraceae bacterium]